MLVAGNITKVYLPYFREELYSKDLSLLLGRPVGCLPLLFVIVVDIGSPRAFPLRASPTSLLSIGFRYVYLLGLL